MSNFYNQIDEKPIVLVGMMASGKSFLGRALAKTLDAAFFDTDKMVEDEAGMSIADIFAVEGEPSFRNREAQAVRSAIEGAAGVRVVATGGGAVLRPDNADLIFGDTISIWTRAPVETILQRTANRTDRPLLKNEDPEKVLRDMATIRYPLYGRAKLTVDTGGRSPDNVLSEILTGIKGLASS